MKKRILAVVLALAMVLALVLTGCGGNDSAKTTAAAAGTTAAPAAATSAGAPATSAAAADANIDFTGTTIDWYHSMGPKESRDVAFDAACDIATELIGLEVVVHFTETSEYKAKVKNLIAVGQAPDVFDTSQTNGFLDYQRDGALLDLSPYFADYMPLTYAKTPEFAWPAVTFDGGVYAIVPIKDLAENNSMLVYKDKFDEAGVEVPNWTSFADADEAFYQVRAWRDEAYPEEYDMPISAIWDSFYRFYVLETYGSASTTVVTEYEGIDIMEGHEPGSEMFSMYLQDCTVDYYKRLSQMVTDRIYPYDTANYDPDSVKRNTGEYYVFWSCGYLEPPTGLTEWDVHLQMQDVSVMYTNYVQAVMNVVSADTEAPEACCAFLELLNNNKEMGTMFRFGIEGINWALDENGQVDCTAGSGENIKYWYGVMIGDITNCILPNDVGPDFGEKIVALNEGATASDNLGFVINNEGLENEITSVSAVCSEYLNASSLSGGMLSLAEVETIVAEFQEKLLANGVETILEGYQSQLNEWRAALGKSVYEG